MDLLFALKAAVLGVIEGITEFLPVSSTGHLIIFSNLLKFYNNADKDYVDMFNMVIQLGAILAVVVLYRAKIIDTIQNLFPGKKTVLAKSGIYFWTMILISCIPAGIIGIKYNDFIKEKLFNPLVVACALFIGGIWMIYAESKLRINDNRSLSDTPIKPWQALVVGLFQVLSIIPGMSRSASTIIGGWVAGFSTVAAAEYSFFLAIPVMFGQSLLNILEMRAKLSIMEWASLAIGFVVSFIVALIVIDSFLNYLKKKPMKIFAVYRMIFAFIVLALGAFGLFIPI
ncbi:undecaprenyl-diphosphate phosphatase [Cellulosilyticum sp. I15G10I2]|uniref:undecaprenyl-diphosphate phosphatase n=1 Tax=Cellulosilyticum sp. I15G10I2 TaxID=1892843 RepID=UPI001495D610|nr:undecaprenyl-diphosphate phosphatase [Cellulosilyticum sp. I15G10I2]